MTLKEYLEINNISAEKFAKLINVSGQAVRYWVLKQRHPAPKHIKNIQSVTNNLVKPESWF